MLSDELTTARRTTAPRLRPLLTVFLGWLWVMTGANLAAPLYAVYATEFGFSSVVLTTVFATYAVTLTLTLLVCGRLADRVGRRPVILAGLVTGALALLLFAHADGVGWLYTARALQGVAVGLISGPATAALVELDSPEAARRPALLAGLAQACGSGLGPLVAGGLAQWAPVPLRLCFYVALAGTGVAAAFTWVLPEPARTGREPWRIRWPRVPGEIRGAFARVSLTAGLLWGSLALYLSVIPSYVAGLLSTHNLALLGGNSALACAASAVALVVARRVGGNGRAMQARGLLTLSAGLLLLVVSAVTQSLTVVLLGAVVTGAGHGLAYLNAQDELNDIAPTEGRGEVTAAFVCCIYLVVGACVVGVGLLGDATTLKVAVGVVGGLLAAAAVVTAGWQLRGRRTV